MKTEIIKQENGKTKIIIYNKNSNRIPIIFLPGFNMKPKDYNKYLTKLKNKKIYAISPFESRPRIRSVEDYVDLLQQTIKHFKIKNFDLIGHSLGGGTALKANEKISPRKIVAINPLLEVNYKYPGYIKRFTRMARRKFIKRFFLYVAFTKRLLLNAYPLNKLLKNIESFKLKKIKTPTLILLAKKDEFFSEENIPKKKFNKLKIIKTNGRHFNLVSFSEEISKYTLDFLKN